MTPANSTSAVSGDDTIQTWAAGAPVISEWKINLSLHNEIAQPRKRETFAPLKLLKSVAADPKNLEGTVGRDNGDLSVLQQHVSFFDRNKDGIVYPWETYQAMRAIGCGVLLSAVGGFLIHFALSYSTITGWLPNLLLPIYVKNIHKRKHGSDTDSYDTEGRFLPEKFDAIFSKYGLTHSDALTENELREMLKSNRNLQEFAGWLMAWTEWKLLYSLAKDDQGLLHREAIRGVYDGSIFEYLEKMKTAVQKKEN